MRFKNWLRLHEISSTNTSMDAAPQQEPMAVMVRKGGAGGGAFHVVDKNDPPRSKTTAQAKRRNPLIAHLPKHNVEPVFK